MRDSRQVRILPEAIEVETSPSTPLVRVLCESGIFLRHDCGGKGRCHKCRVVVEPGGQAAATVEACTYRVEDNLTVRIPENSRVNALVIDKAPLVFPPNFAPAPPSNAVPQYGLAVDLGTTTIAVYLCETIGRRVIASAAVKNPQSIYGDDVINRIGAIAAAKGKVRLLQQPVVRIIERAIGDLCRKAAISPSQVDSLVVSGNPTMLHILLGVDPEPIGCSPYAPMFTAAQRRRADELGFAVFTGTVRTLPLVSGFIGADTIAATIAVDLPNQPVGTLMVDLGTNGELVLAGERGLISTSCATGPAFEGATLSCGMQATPGAIDRVELHDSCSAATCSIIGADRAGRKLLPAGICGSGIISAVTALRRHGIIAESGAFRAVAGHPLLQRDAEGSQFYILVEGTKTEDGLPITISQKDIRAVQLGKAALRTGIDFLLRAAGLAAPSQILLAGAFGSNIAAGDLISLGILPNIDLRHIRSLGNAAGAGTVMVLSDPACRRLADDIAAAITAIDLAASPDFLKVFVDNLAFTSS